MCTGPGAETQRKTRPHSSERAEHPGFLQQLFGVISQQFRKLTHIFIFLVPDPWLERENYTFTSSAPSLPPKPTSQLSQHSALLGLSQSRRVWRHHATLGRKFQGELEGSVTRNAFGPILKDSSRMRRGPVNLTAFCKGYCLLWGWSS